MSACGTAVELVNHYASLQAVSIVDRQSPLLAHERRQIIRVLRSGPLIRCGGADIEVVTSMPSAVSHWLL